jgi:succinate dehydrogenase / fumarate reductase flavoprotein subunit
MSGYPESVQESIRKLEGTRLSRAQEEIPLLSLKERQELLQRYHPDFRDGGRREIHVGINQGQRVPHELADLFEGESRVRPDEVDLARVKRETDVLIIGGGGGGASAALFAKANGAKTLITTKLRFGDSNTIMAEGGIQAAVGQFDSPALHYLDTVGGGGFQNLPHLVNTLVSDAPMILEWLGHLGVMFDRKDNGDLLASFAGGQCRRRVHSAADYTGMEIMRVLKDEVYHQGIEVLEFCAAAELVLDDQRRCAGAVFINLDTGERFVIRSKTVILATGGIGRLHIQGFPTTNHYGATADGLVIANRAGAKIIFMDAIQFHPTGTAYPEQLLGLLVSEAFRGWSAQLVNREGKRFINELETRDITSSAAIREVMERGNGVATPTGMQGVWLDTPLVEMNKGKGTIHQTFPHLFHRFHNFGIDITREPILVYPTQHYQNGGILIDEYGETNVENLFGIGEVSGGVHGRNRLGGNSLLDIFVFGRRAGIKAAARSKEIEIGKLSLDHVLEYEKELERAGALKRGIQAPLLLPDYRFEKALAKTHQ